MVTGADEGQAWQPWVGAASSPLGAGYEPRSPDGTVLHWVVREHLATFLEDARLRSAHGFGLPGFVEREFREYFGCGVLAHGFAAAMGASFARYPEGGRAAHAGALRLVRRRAPGGGWGATGSVTFVQ